MRIFCHTVVEGGNFFIEGGFSPIEGPTHLRVRAARNRNLEVTSNVTTLKSSTIKIQEIPYKLIQLPSSGFLQFDWMIFRSRFHTAIAAPLIFNKDSNIKLLSYPNETDNLNFQSPRMSPTDFLWITQLFLCHDQTNIPAKKL